MAKEPRDLSKSWIVIIGLPIFLTVLGALVSPLGQQVTNALFGQTDPVDKSSVTEATLQIAAISYDDTKGDLDVQLRNTDDADAAISKLTVSLLKEEEFNASGELLASQGFELPINEVPVGQEKSIKVNHVVTAKQADRIRINLATFRQLRIRLTITYNGSQTISEETWLFPAFAPEQRPH